MHARSMNYSQTLRNVPMGPSITHYTNFIENSSQIVRAMQGQSIDRSQSGALESDRSKECDTCNNLAIPSILHTREKPSEIFFYFSFYTILVFFQSNQSNSNIPFALSNHTHIHAPRKMNTQKWRNPVFNAACTLKNWKIYEDGKGTKERESLTRCWLISSFSDHCATFPRKWRNYRKTSWCKSNLRVKKN